MLRLIDLNGSLLVQAWVCTDTKKFRQKENSMAEIRTGTCVFCRKPTYERGTVPSLDNTDSQLDENDVSDDGLAEIAKANPICICFVCANTEPCYKAAVAAANRKWRAIASRS